MNDVDFTNQAQQDRDPPNRGNDNRRTEEQPNQFVGFQDIDSAIIQYINEHIQPSVVDLENDEKVTVPVLYGNAERWSSIQQHGYLRDNGGKFQLPVMVIRRKTMRKNKMNSPINRYLGRTMHIPQWNKRNAYDRFAVANGVQPSDQFLNVNYPDYYDIIYECFLWTDYQEQMNDLVEQISFEVENYWGTNNGFRFKTSVEEYSNEVDLPSDQDRSARASFDLKVNGYVLPENKLDNLGRPENLSKIAYSVKKVVFGEEIVTDISDE